MDRNEKITLINKKDRELRTLENQALLDGNTVIRQRVFLRRRLLAELATREVEPFSSPTAFISFSSRSGSNEMKAAKLAFEKREVVVRTGFDEEVQKQDNKLTAIKRHIRGSGMFLGIVTPEYQLAKARKKWCPGVWVLEEKGIAEAFDLPMRLLVHEEVHDDFFVKVGGDKLRTKYDTASFAEKMNDAVTALLMRFYERRVIETVT